MHTCCCKDGKAFKNDNISDCVKGSSIKLDKVMRREEVSLGPFFEP